MCTLPKTCNKEREGKKKKILTYLNPYKFNTTSLSTLQLHFSPSHQIQLDGVNCDLVSISLVGMWLYSLLPFCMTCQNYFAKFKHNGIELARTITQPYSWLIN